MAKQASAAVVVQDTRETIHMKFVGTRPILLHNERLADPFNDIVRDMKKITAIRKKTDENLLEIMRLEYIGGLYHNDDVGVYIPDINILAALVEAARMRKLGKVLNRALDIAETEIPLIYDGPTDPEKLAQNKQFRDRRGCVVGQSKVMRTRPRFNEWSLEFDLIYDAEQIDRDQVILIAHDAGTKIGLCDFRPRFGRFAVEVS